MWIAQCSHGQYSLGQYSLGQYCHLDKNVTWTIVSHGQCSLGQSSLGQKSTWTIFPWTTIATPFYDFQGK